MTGFGLAPIKEEGTMRINYREGKLPPIERSKAVWIDDNRYTKEDYAKLRIREEPFFK